MTRKKLTDAIASAVEPEGFTFHCGFGYRTAPQIKKLPAAWLNPPVLQKKEGREEGFAIYSVVLDLIERAPTTETDKENKWESFENKTDAICARLRKNPDIQELTDLEYAPAELSVTAKGELSVRLSFKVRLPFCNYCDNI